MNKFFLTLTILLILSACAPAFTPALTPGPPAPVRGSPEIGRGESALTPTHLTLDPSHPSTTLRASLTPSPTAAPTITPTPTPAGVGLEQLKAMTAEQKLAAAPESPQGHAKSLYREAPNLVFYQDSDLTVTGAYDLATGTTYSSAEEIPLPAIQITVSREILGADFHESVENISKIKDTVLSGEEPFYRLRVLQAYRDGLTPQISEKIESYKFYKSEYSVGGDIWDTRLQDLENRPWRNITLVQDGEGGLRLVQVWKQPDGTVGVVWDHMTYKFIWSNGSGRIGLGFEKILESMFEPPFITGGFNS